MRIRILNSLLLVSGILCLSAQSSGQVSAYISIAPPALPVYEQPICPGDGYLWTPGYWAWDNEYYWVEGMWAMPPQVGYLWTPGYWGWGGSGFLFNEGYWGLAVGFYGGIDYGYGYFGRGYEGGRWDHGHLFYNTAFNNVNRSFNHNVYDERVNETVNHVSYNGGNGGVNARASAQEEASAHDRRIAPVAAQTENARVARNEPQQRFSANHGAPTSAAARSAAAVHPKELPAIERPGTPNTGNSNLDRKYQKQQDKLVGKQTQERQKLQQTQDREHQQLAQRSAAEAKTQQVEQRHQQQTQQLQQRHTQQTQQMSQRQSSGGGGSRGGGGGGSRGGGGGGGHR